MDIIIKTTNITAIGQSFLEFTSSNGSFCYFKNCGKKKLVKFLRSLSLITYIVEKQNKWTKKTFIPLTTGSF